MARTVAFFSYRRPDDQNLNGLLSKIRAAMEAQLRVHYSDDAKIYPDRDDLRLGDDWQAELDQALSEAVLLIPVLTPNFFTSENCRAELQRFLERAHELRETRLVMPIL